MSSCLIQAGRGICNETDKGAAINKHLTCVFSLLATPTFGKCVRVHIASLGTLSIDKVKGALPGFITCVQQPVLDKCGPTPINVLRALAESGKNCVLDVAEQPISEPIVPVPEVKPEPESQPEPAPSLFTDRCDAYASNVTTCFHQYLDGYKFHMIRVVPVIRNAMCSKYQKYTECMPEHVDGCEPFHPPLANLLELACLERPELIPIQVHQCLDKVALSEEGKRCVRMYGEDDEMNTTDECEQITEVHECISSEVRKRCGDMGLDFMYRGVQLYAREVGEGCQPKQDFIAVSTGCVSKEMDRYLSCEHVLEPYNPQLFYMLDDPNTIDRFCVDFNDRFLPCMNNLTCKPQPISKATEDGYSHLCLRKERYKSYSECLNKFKQTPEAQQCFSEHLSQLDFLAENASEEFCNKTNEFVRCSGDTLYQMCDVEVLGFAYEMNQAFLYSFNEACLLEPPPLHPRHPQTTGAQPTTDTQPEPESQSPEPQPEPTSEGSKPEPESTGEPQPTNEATKPEPTTEQGIISASFTIFLVIGYSSPTHHTNFLSAHQVTTVFLTLTVFTIFRRNYAPLVSSHPSFVRPPPSVYAPPSRDDIITINTCRNETNDDSGINFSANQKAKSKRARKIKRCDERCKRQGFGVDYCFEMATRIDYSHSLIINASLNVHQITVELNYLRYSKALPQALCSTTVF